MVENQKIRFDYYNFTMFKCNKIMAQKYYIIGQ